ncbi:unnamed protein product [Cladocopium goreaui]|uniref:Uncharacterized protein n=1 Tax=Cladocopium goreaui TaxID=2562237 RepID=A0A9P1DAR9_9DINO|nr:unnamed protein product [Cladocopium goreaui]CAI4006890.1 unnamed protein product [Cladocopium goreaui]
MIDRSWSWARSHGLVRENSVHGEEEARLVLVDSFHNENERGEMRNLRGEGEVEDADGALLDSEGLVDPAVEGGDTAHDPSDPKTEQAAAAAAAAASGNSKLRDCSFICQSCTWNRMAKEIEKLVKSLNDKYDALSQKQADYLSMDTSQSLETKKKDLMALFAEITKDDVTLNNYISRSKNIKAPASSTSTPPPRTKPAKSSKGKKEKALALPNRKQKPEACSAGCLGDFPDGLVDLHQVQMRMTWPTLFYRHSYTTRLLATLMPANWYAKKDATISGIFLEALANDLTRLFESGVTCVSGEMVTWYAGYIACKGDWPWLRKAYSLSTGFRSSRICHLCEGTEPQRIL